MKSSVEGTQSLNLVDTVTAITELVKSAPAAVIYVVALAALYKFTNSIRRYFLSLLELSPGSSCLFD